MIAEYFDEELEIIPVGIARQSERVPLSVNVTNPNERILSWLEYEEYWPLKGKDYHLVAIVAFNHRRRHNRQTVSMIQESAKSITHVKQHGADDPDERLASFVMGFSVFSVHRVYNCDDVQCDKRLVDRIENSIRDTMPKVRRESDSTAERSDEVSGDHDFRSQTVTKLLIPSGAQSTVQENEPQRRHGDEREHCVCQIDVDLHGAVEWEKVADICDRQRRNRVTCHCQRNEGHLKENGVLRAEDEWARESLIPGAQLRIRQRGVLYHFFVLQNTEMNCRR